MHWQGQQYHGSMSDMSDMGTLLYCDSHPPESWGLVQVHEQVVQVPGQHHTMLGLWEHSMHSMGNSSAPKDMVILYQLQRICLYCITGISVM